MSVDIDKLSDEEFMALMDEAESNTAIEGTDTSDEYEDSTETTEDDDDQNLDTEESEYEEEDGNTQETTDSTEELNETEEQEVTEPSNDTEEEADEATSENTKDENELTEDEQAKEDQKNADNLDIDVEEYKRLKDFYSTVTGEFVANGKKVKGFTDPNKIVQAQQMALGLNNKLAAFKPYKPYMKAIKDLGMLDNPDKFNLIMDAAQGQKEALVKLMQDNGIDPFELEVPEDEKISYTPTEHREDDIEVILEDTLTEAEVYGVKDKVEDILKGDWDVDSVATFLTDDAVHSAVLTHMQNGAFDDIQGRITEKARLDFTGKYVGLPKIEQYKIAAAELANEYEQQQRSQVSTPNFTTQQKAEESTEVAKEEFNTSEQEAYKAKAAAERKQLDEARKKASSVSRKKRSAPKKVATNTFDPAEMSDEEISKMLDSFMYGG